MASTDATYSVARLAERADERYRALIRRGLESQQALAVTPPVREGVRAWVDAWLRMFKPRKMVAPALPATTAMLADRGRQATAMLADRGKQATAMLADRGRQATTMADAWAYAFVSNHAYAPKQYPTAPDLLMHGGIRRLPRASERSPSVRNAASRGHASRAEMNAAAYVPVAPVAWVTPPITDAPRWMPPQCTPDVVDPAASFAEHMAYVPTEAPTSAMTFFPRALAPTAPDVPVARVMSLLAEARPFQGLDADAYREHIAVKAQALEGEGRTGSASADASAKQRSWRFPVALARGIVSGLKSAGRAVGAGLKNLLGAGKRGARAIDKGSRKVASATSRAIRDLGAPALALLVAPLSLAKAIAGWRPRSSTPEGNGIMAAAVPFQPDIDEIIEQPAPRGMRSLHYFIVALFVLLLVIASLIKVEIIVQGSGQLTTEISPIMLQPIERGIIREIKVKAGDIVTKGQVLASLDPTFSDADVSLLRAQHHVLTTGLRRIEAEMTDTDFVVTQVGDPNEDLQAALYLQRKSQYSARLRAYDEELNRWESNIKATKEEQNFLGQQLQIANEVEGVRNQLWQNRLTSKLQVLDSQNTRLRYQRDHQAATEKLKDLQHSLDGRRAERQAFTDDWRRQLLEDMLNKRSELTRINEQLAKAARLNDLVLLKAPEDGVILEVARRSVGSVMREAEPLVTMVPSNAKLIAEVMIGSRDVGYAAKGDRVVIKVDAFPYQRHGMVEGRLSSISEESFNPGRSGTDGTGSPMPSMSGALHRARIDLVNTKLEKMPEGARFIPGMTVSAEINVGRRSVISFFLNPITRGLQESVREP